MFIGITIDLSSPPLTTFTFSLFVSVIFSKSWTTGCIDVRSLVVEATEVDSSIHFVGYNKDLLLPTKLSIDVSLYPILNSLEDKISVIEFVDVNELPIFSDNLVTVASLIES